MHSYPYWKDYILMVLYDPFDMENFYGTIYYQYILPIYKRVYSELKKIK